MDTANQMLKLLKEKLGPIRFRAPMPAFDFEKYQPPS